MFANIYTACQLTDEHIRPVKETEMQGAFTFRIFESDNDSIRILLENHTDLPVQPLFFPSVETDDGYMVHPFARSGWVEEANYMKRRALLKGGEAVLFVLPVSWDIRRVAYARYKKQFGAGRLAPGKYKIGLQLEIYLDTEFEVK